MRVAELLNPGCRLESPGQRGYFRALTPGTSQIDLLLILCTFFPTRLQARTIYILSAQQARVECICEPTGSGCAGQDARKLGAEERGDGPRHSPVHGRN